MNSDVTNKILVIQLTKMGDFLQTTPLLYEIKRRYPNAELSALVDTRCVEVATGIPFIDKIIPLDLTSIHDMINGSKHSLFQKYSYLNDSLKDLKESRFDLIYNINFSVISALLCRLFGDSRVVGYRLDLRTHKLIKEPWVSFIFGLMKHRNLLRFNLVDLLASYEKGDELPCSGIFYNTDGGEIASLNLLPAKDRGTVTIGLQMGCGGHLRQWPVEYYVALAQRLVQDFSAQIVLFGSQGERHLAEHFNNEWSRLAGNKPPEDYVVDLIGKTTIPQLAGTLKKCNMLIGGDTGTIHLATAVGTRVVAIFMSTALCHETGPYGDGHFVLQAHMECSPCTEGSGSCQEPVCQRLINPDMVYAVVSYILRNKDGGNIDDFYPSAHLEEVCRDSPCGYPVSGRDKPSPYDELNLGRDEPSPYDEMNVGRDKPARLALRSIAGPPSPYDEPVGQPLVGCRPPSPYDESDSEYVQIYQTRMDEWGVKFLPFIPREPDIGEVMAVAYREVGRKLMRPAYQIDPESILSELTQCHCAVADGTREKLNLVSGCVSDLFSICELGAKNGASISSVDLDERVQQCCGSIDVLSPLSGYFGELKAQAESSIKTGDGTVDQDACKAMLIPVRELLDLMEYMNRHLMLSP